MGGEALIDLVIDPLGGVIAKHGGGPYNTARTIARLGITCRYLGSMSDDRFGTLMQAQLRADGVDTSALRHSSAPTTLAAAEIDESGAAQYRFYFEGTSAPDFPLESRPSLASVSAFHVGTLGLVFEPMATTFEAMVNETAADVLVVLDPNCRPLVIGNRAAYLERVARVMRRADVVKVSTDDLDYLDPHRSPIEAARRMLEVGPAVVLVTAGGDTATVVSRAGEVAVPVPGVVVADTIGAGDSFGGGFTAWWVGNGLGRAELSDLDLLEQATRAGVTVAARTCERPGADPPHRDELPADWGRRR